MTDRVTASDRPDGPPQGARSLAWLARLGVTAVLLALIVRQVSPGEIAGALRSARRLPLLAGAGLGGVFLALKVFRWGWLLRRLGVPCSPAEALYSYLGGMAV